MYHENGSGIYSCTLWVRIHCRLLADEHELSWPLLLPRLLAAENQSVRALVSQLVNSLRVLGINKKDIGAKSDFVNLLGNILTIKVNKWF
jgi:hypothetical protein